MGLNFVCLKWASGSFIGSMVRAAPGHAVDLSAVGLLLQVPALVTVLGGLQQQPRGTAGQISPQHRSKPQNSQSCCGGSVFIRIQKSIRKVYGEASTWGKVWGRRALTQEVPKPVISGDWKKIPRNSCVLLTLFSYFGLCCWQPLEMRQAVTWWGKCSIAACVQKVSWQMP